MKRLLSVLLVLGGALLGLSACAKDFVLSSPPLEGRVLERGTHRPVPEARVVVLWKGVVGWSGTVCFHVATATTDASGTYRLPAWQKPSPYGDIQGRHHVALAYKPGYEYVGGNQATIYLKPFSGSREERLAYLLRTSSATRCGESGASEKNLLSLKKSLYEEAKSIATTAEDQDKVETLLFGLESLEFGSIEALNRMSERREVKK